MKKKNLKTWLIPKLRRFSYQFGPWSEAKKLARISRGKYKCAECEREGVEKEWTTKEIYVDHIDPVVSPENGFETWDIYIERLFCDVEGLQVLCKPHHDIKSKGEAEIRKETRSKQKEDNKD